MRYYLFTIEMQSRLTGEDLELARCRIGLNFQAGNDAHTMQAGFEASEGLEKAMDYLAKLIRETWPNVRSTGIYM